MKRDERLVNFARQMRHTPVPAEEVVWRILRNRRLAGFKFRRQHPVALVVLELDGDTHVGREDRDCERDEYFRGLGIEVLRVWNPQVREDEEAFVEAVFRLCSERTKVLPEHPRHAGVRRWRRDNM